MAKLEISLTGDQELIDKISFLGTAINRRISAAFRPAAKFLRPFILNYNFKWRGSGRIPNTDWLKVRAMKRSRVMKGTQLISMFGTTDPKNDPFYGVMAEFGHYMGPVALGSARPWIKGTRFMTKTFQEHDSEAAAIATESLKTEVELLWSKSLSELRSTAEDLSGDE